MFELKLVFVLPLSGLEFNSDAVYYHWLTSAHECSRMAKEMPIELWGNRMLRTESQHFRCMCEKQCSGNLLLDRGIPWFSADFGQMHGWYLKFRRGRFLSDSLFTNTTLDYREYL
jgi:hypothetical protein